MKQVRCTNFGPHPLTTFMLGVTAGVLSNLIFMAIQRLANKKGA